MSDTASSTRAPVTVSLHDLEQGTVPFATLEAAFGPSSLGIISVSDLPPSFSPLRHRLLSYSSYLANLPAEELEKLECPSAKWLVGWSCGRETLKNGVYDTLKGSYYVNCAFYKDPSLSGATGDYPSFPEYTAPNIWPAESIFPTFRATFEELCTVVIDVAVLVARACDRYAENTIAGYKANSLEGMVKSSTTSKARLLHYFPPSSTKSKGRADANSAPNGDDDGDDDWCATHLDHGCLTGLTSAMFVDESSIPHVGPRQSQLPPSTLKEISSPDPSAGLYVQSRAGDTVKVGIPGDQLAFQTGEALELITHGKFKAVPHFVKGAKASHAQVARNTLAVFTQPNLDEMVDEKRDFAAFAKDVVERNH